MTPRYRVNARILGLRLTLARLEELDTLASAATVAQLHTAVSALTNYHYTRDHQVAAFDRKAELWRLAAQLGHRLPMAGGVHGGAPSFEGLIFSTPLDRLLGSARRRPLSPVGSLDATRVVGAADAATGVANAAVPHASAPLLDTSHA
jgi:hypothetical protein